MTNRRYDLGLASHSSPLAADYSIIAACFYVTWTAREIALRSDADRTIA